MENNVYIETWKQTIITIISFYSILYKNDYPLSKKVNDIRELASKQLKILDETKPNKQVCLYTQCNQQQKEFIDYLEKVIVYGNLEGKDYVNS